MAQKLVTCFPVFVWEYGHYPDVRESPGPAASVLLGGSLCSTPHQDLSTGDTSEAGRVSNLTGPLHCGGFVCSQESPFCPTGGVSLRLTPTSMAGESP